MTQLRDLTGIARIAKTGTVIYGLANLVYAAVLIWYNQVYRAYLDGSAESEAPLLQADNVLVVYSLIFLGIFIGVFAINGRWIYLASSNAAVVNPVADHISPGWAVGWYFVPIMNLFKPYVAMREIWAGSVGMNRATDGQEPGWFTIWWGLWVVLNIADTVSAQIGVSPAATAEQYISGNTYSAIISLCWVVPTYFFWRIIDQVTAAQSKPSDVFA